MRRNNSKILITGGAGFIGSHLVDRLIEEGSEVIVLDNLFTGRKENLHRNWRHPNFRFVSGDMRDAKLVKGLVRDVDIVFHEAAITSVPLTVKDPVLAHDVNATGTLNILNACVNSDTRRFIFASSCAVYGDAPVSPQNESSPLSFLSPYAVTKAFAESYCRLFHQLYGIETISLRLFNVYGPRQVAGEHGGVVAKFLEKLAKNKQPVIFGDGEQTRDLTHIEDVVEAHMLAVNVDNISGETINIAAGHPTSLNDLLRTMAEVMGVATPNPIYAEARSGDIRNSHGDVTKAERLLGYKPKFSLREGLREFLHSH